MNARSKKHTYKGGSSAAGSGLRVAGAALTLVSIATTTATATAWDVRRSRSAMDDSPSVFLQVDAARPVFDKFGRRYLPRLTIRCLENTTAFIVQFEGLFLGSERMSVRYRIDDEPARHDRWGISTDYYSVGRWRNTVGFVRSLIGRDRFRLEIVPYGESSVVATFNISGLEDIIAPLAEACHWSVTPQSSAVAPANSAPPRPRPAQPQSEDFDALIEKLTTPADR